MCSSASGWAGGRMGWRVTHDAQRGVSHLGVEGTPPAAYAGIAESLLARQRDHGDADHLFDAPVELARALTGFRYDGNPDGYPVDRFAVLRRRPQKPWWIFWR